VVIVVQVVFISSGFKNVDDNLKVTVDERVTAVIDSILDKKLTELRKRVTDLEAAIHDIQRQIIDNGVR
jgi:hypothetical protein